MNAFVVFMIIHITTVYGYELICPDRSHLRIYSKAACPNPLDFTCLKDVLLNKYRTVCDKCKPAPPGLKYVLFGQNYDAEDCESNRYQPFVFIRNQQTDCFYIKSACNEEGQIVYSNGSTTSDVKCKCDEKSGFTYVTQPRNQSFCIPSEEDCSCYRKLNKASSNNEPYDTSRPNLAMSINGTLIGFPIVSRINAIKDFKETVFSNKSKAIIAVAVMLLLIIVLGLGTMFWFYKRTKEMDDDNKVVYPSAIYKMDEESREVFENALKCGSEIKREIRVIVVGKKEAGKTSLIRRLRSKTIKGVKATDGIDIHSIICKDGDNNISWQEETHTADSRLLNCTILEEKRIHNGPDDVSELVNERLEHFGNKTDGVSKSDTTTEKTTSFTEENTDGSDGAGVLLPQPDKNDRYFKQPKTKQTEKTPIPAIKSTAVFEVVNEGLIQSETKQTENTNADVVTEGSKVVNKLLVQSETKHDSVNKSDTKQIEKTTPFAENYTDGSEVVNKLLVQSETKPDSVNKSDTKQIEKTTPFAENYTDVSEGANEQLAKSNKKGEIIEQPETKYTEKTSEHAEKSAAVSRVVNEALGQSRTKQTENTTKGVEKVTRENKSSLYDLKSKQLDNNAIESSHKSTPMETNTIQQDKDYEDIKDMVTAKEIDAGHIRLSVWDFGGDEEFYYTHQLFLAEDAVYVIVTSLEPSDDSSNKEFEFEFWFDTIHCLCENRKKKKLSPRCIVVGTKTDLCQNAESAIKEKLRSVNKVLRKHIYGPSFLISNKKSDDKTISDIKRAIIDAAKEGKEWEAKHPMKFILLDKALEKKRSELEKRPVITRSVIQDMNNMLSKPLSAKELDFYLRYNHLAGHLIYYEDIPGCIVIVPQWLGDLFRCIVTADKFRPSELPQYDLNELRSTGKITDTLLNDIFVIKKIDVELRPYLMKIMEKFHIVIQLSGSTEDTSKMYFAPCMVRGRALNVENISIKDEVKSTWLCLECDFIPPFLFNHIIISFCEEYLNVGYLPQFYSNGAVLDISTNRCDKLVILKLGNVIQLQTMMLDQPNNQENIYIKSFLTQKMEELTKTFSMKIKYEYKWKCPDSWKECSELMKMDDCREGEKYHCKACNTLHIFENYWKGNTQQEHVSKDKSTLRRKENLGGGYLNELPKNTKRWMVIGDVLNSMLAPTLRKYVSGSLAQIYKDLKQNNNIDTQLYPQHLQNYLASHLNYEAINGNKAWGLKQQSEYNYQVKDAVDLSKLFLKTHTVHFDSFDDSCDVFALLEIIIGSCPFPTQEFARRVKEKVLNPWAYVDFTVWTDDMYETCKKLIKDLTESIGLQTRRKITVMLDNLDQQGYLNELPKNRKRWLVTGDVLNSVLAPTLRKYVTNSLRQIYQDLMQNSNIDTQNYPNHLTNYLTTYLNYEAINGNKVWGLRRQSEFNYKVKDEVDLSKLFLRTHMIHYNAFDDSCDVFALLGIVIGSCPFLTQGYAKKVKNEVWIPWAHYDFTVWDDNMYQTCMKLINGLIQNLSLHNNEEIITMFQEKIHYGEKYINGHSQSLFIPFGV